MRLPRPWRRDPDALPAGEEKALGKRLRRAIDQAADGAGIKPGGFREDDGEQENDEGDRTT